MFKNISFGRIALVFGIFVALTLIAIPSYKWYDTHRELVAANVHISLLQTDSTLAVNNYLKLENKYLKTAKEKADIVDASKDAGESAQRQLAEANRKLASTIASANLEKKKALADRNVGGVGAVETTVSQGGLNGQIASIKGQLEAALGENGELVTKNGALTEENKILTEENKDLKSQVSELENIENKVYVEVAKDWKKEYEQKRLLGWGRKAAAKAKEKEYLSRLKVSK